MLLFPLLAPIITALENHMQNNLRSCDVVSLVNSAKWISALNFPYISLLQPHQYKAWVPCAVLIFDDVLTSLATYDSPPIWRKPQMIILERYCLNWTRNIYEKQNNLPNWFRKIKDKMKEIQNRDLRVRSKRLMLSRIFQGHSAIDFGWHWRTDNDMGRTVTKDTPGHNNDHILQMQSKNIGYAETNNILCSCGF